MNKSVFLDTNVLVYMDDRDAGKKQRRAIELIERHTADQSSVLSLQVLQEYYSATTKKLGTPADIAQRKVEVFSRGRVIHLDTGDLISAIELYRLQQISFWDALIVYAARKAGAPVLYTEDMKHGAVIGGVRIENPFL